MKIKASVAIVALVTSSLLVILSLILIQIVHFSQFNQFRFSKKLAAQWFLEGRVNEYLDRMINEGRAFQKGNFVFSEKIRGKEQKYFFKVSPLSSSDWKIEASMLWRKEVPVREEMVIRRDSLFEYSILFKSTRPWKISKETLFSGKIRFESSPRVFAKKGFSWWIESEPEILPGVSLSAKKLDIRESEIESFLSGELSSLRERPLTYRIRKEKKDVPDYEDIFRSYQNYLDPSWIIEDPSFYETLTIVNDLDSYKLKVDEGNGYRTEFIVDSLRPKQIYISPDIGDWKRILFSRESYGYGAGTKDFIAYDANKMILKASLEKEPLAIELPREAYQTLGKIILRNKSASFISIYEEPAYVAFNQKENRYYLDRDFTYDPQEASIQFISKRFLNRFIKKIGVGSGDRYRFNLPGIHGNFGVYVNGRLAELNERDQVSFTLKIAPPKGADVSVWMYPSLFFLSKKAPSDRLALYRDPQMEAILLDLDEIQNYPVHSVIYSKYPLYIRGKARENLVILCDSDIYLGAINEKKEGKTLLLSSKTGIWGLLPEDGKAFLYHVILVSPMDTFPVIHPETFFGGGKFTLFGTLILTGKQNRRVMNIKQELPNVLRDSQVIRDKNRFPFSVFPSPMRILSVERH